MSCASIKFGLMLSPPIQSMQDGHGQSPDSEMVYYNAPVPALVKLDCNVAVNMMGQ